MPDASRETQAKQETRVRNTSRFYDYHLRGPVVQPNGLEAYTMYRRCSGQTDPAQLQA